MMQIVQNVWLPKAWSIMTGLGQSRDFGKGNQMSRQDYVMATSIVAMIFMINPF